MRTNPIAKSVKVTVDIQATQGTAYQRKLWIHWWQKVITDCQRDLKAESEARRE